MAPEPESNQVTKREDEWNWQWTEDGEDGDFLIWPENWATWICFLELGDQWEMVGAQGFYYNGLPVDRIDRVLARARMTPDDEHIAWQALKAMAAVAKPVLNEKLREAVDPK